MSEGDEIFGECRSMRFVTTEAQQDRASSVKCDQIPARFVDKTNCKMNKDDVGRT